MARARPAPSRTAPRGRAAEMAEATLLGDRFGLLTVVGEAEPYVWRGRVTHRCWRCRCDCGQDTVARQDALASGHTRSCGCEKVRVATESHTRHGARAAGKRSYEYDLWLRLGESAREEDLVLPAAWSGADGFAAFLDAVGPRPGPRHRLHCDPGRSSRMARNWHWVEDLPRRGVPRWVLVHRGTTMTFRELAEVTGTRYATLLKRFARGRPILDKGAIRGPYAAG